MKHRKLHPFVWLLGTTLAAAGLPATSSEPVRSQAVEARTIVGYETATPGAVLMVGLELRMKPGWHTYWTNPGDSGQATTWELRGPSGTGVEPFAWPLPERIVSGPLVSYGYHGRVVFLREVRLPKNLPSQGTVLLESDVTWLECAELCIPGKATLRLPLRLGLQNVVHPQHQNGLVQAERLTPRPAPPHWRFRPSLEKDRASFELRGSGPLKVEYFFPNHEVRLAFAETQKFTTSSDGIVGVLPVDPAAGSPKTLAGVLVVRSGTERVGYLLSVGNSPGRDGLGLLSAIVFAFLGGLILNLMPCVLPVLSIKVQSLLARSGESRAQSLLHGGFLALGVILSFWAMAAVILLGRAGGESLGWGFQLQSPIIVATLAGVMLLFALNLMGVFEVGAALQRSGSQVHGTGLWGSFLTGVLAVIVAAPCTAPFMGAALGFALVQSVPVALGVFTALALGLAFPYLLLSAFPSWLGFLPKPGAWMDTLRKSMGFLLAAAVAWLVWLLGRLVGVDAMGTLLGSLLLLSAAAWVYGHLVQNATARPRARVAAGVVAGLAVGGALLLGVLSTGTEATPQNRASSGSLIAWEPYAEQKVSSLRASGRAVFVDFTADWCLSCKVNERTSLETAAVSRRMRELDVVALRADWTRHDPAITRAIEAHGRSGVPLYVVYPRGGGEPFLLPEVLTEAMVLRALERASQAKGRPAAALP